MAKPAKTSVVKLTSSQKETPLDKTTRIVRRITEEEDAVRHQKTARLRKARFESAAADPDSVLPPVSSRAKRKG